MHVGNGVVGGNVVDLTGDDSDDSSVYSDATEIMNEPAHGNVLHAEAMAAENAELDAMVAEMQAEEDSDDEGIEIVPNDEDNDGDVVLPENPEAAADPPAAAAGGGDEQPPGDLPNGVGEPNQPTGVRMILVTINKYDDTPDATFLDKEETEKVLLSIGKVTYLAWQYERGGNTNRLHLHAFVQFSDKWRFQRMRTMWGQLGSVYLNTVTRGGANVTRVNEYCTKEDTRERGPFFTGQIRGEGGEKRQRVGEELADAINEAQDAKRSWLQFVRGNAGLIGIRSTQVKALWEDMLLARADAGKQRRFLTARALPWQQDLVRYCRDQWGRPLWQMEGDKPENPRDDRSIIWIVDKRGNSGKSKVAHFIDCEHARFNEEPNHEGSVVFLEPGKKADMAHAVRAAYGCDTAIIDVPRQRGEGETGVEYMNIFLEGLKNGKVFSPKYDSTMLSLGTAIVIVTSNHEFEGSMTGDRVKQFTLDIPKNGDVCWAGQDLLTRPNLAYNRKEARMGQPWTEAERTQLRLFPLKPTGALNGVAAAEGFVYQ